MGYATLIGSELMQDCQLQKVGNTGGVRFGKGPCCICCCAFKQNLDDFTGQTVAVAAVDNGCGFPCPCIPNTGQRCTLEMPSDQTNKLDVLLLTIIKVASSGFVMGPVFGHRRIQSFQEEGCLR